MRKEDEGLVIGLATAGILVVIALLLVYVFP
jgi:tetrahydromethanopterin S-methyltransferase subunit F